MNGAILNKLLTAYNTCYLYSVVGESAGGEARLAGGAGGAPKELYLTAHPHCQEQGTPPPPYDAPPPYHVAVGPVEIV